MKIAMFTDTFLPQENGVVSEIIYLLKYLHRKHQIALFVPGEDGFRKVRGMFKNVTIYELPSKKFRFYPGYRRPKMMIRQVDEIFSKNRFDIIHTHSPISAGLLALIMSRFYNIPIVGHYHTLIDEYAPHLVAPIGLKFHGVVKKVFAPSIHLYIRKFYGCMGYTIAPSREIKRFLNSKGVDNVIVIPNGIDFERLKINRKRGGLVRKKYGIPDKKKIVLYVGRISFEKRLEKLLEAYKRIEAENNFLLIAGKGPKLEYYKKLSTSLGLKNVRFLGYVPDKDLPYIYDSCDVFASASDTEVFGLTFLEAMSFGKPVVGARSYGVKDVINPRNGFLVTPGDSRMLAEKISILLKDDKLRRRLGKYAKSYCRRYSYKIFGKEHERLYAKARARYNSNSMAIRMLKAYSTIAYMLGNSKNKTSAMFKLT